VTIRTRIAGVDRSSLVAVGSLRIQSRLNTRNRASLGLVDTTGTYRPSVGSEVIIDNGENLFLYSDNPNGTGWTRGDVTIATGYADPFGGRNAWRMTEATTNNYHYLERIVTVTAQTYSLRIWARSAGRRYFSLYPQYAGAAYAIFDLQTGTVAGTGGAQYVTSSITPAGGDWYECRLSIAASAGSMYTEIYMGSTASAAPSYLGTGAAIEFYGYGISAGTAPSPYAATTTAAAPTERYFGGFVDSFTESLTIDGNQTALSYEVECVSYDALADRRLVAASYESGSQTLSTIVGDVVTNFLTGDGLTTTNVDTGPVIDRLKFNYEPASRVFDELANITGYAWWVDESKALWFKPRAGVAAPFAVDSSNTRRVTVNRTTETYRNKQLVRAGVDLTASRTENFSGNGTQKAWTLAYPVGATPTALTVGGVSKTVGIRGVDTGKDWYYQIGDPVISQDDGAAAVGAAVAIAVTYRGQFPILISAQNDSGIASQASISSTAGVYESIEERPNLNDDEAAGSIAEGLLRRYGAIPRRLSFETDTTGLKPGQLLTAAYTPHAVTGSWLVDAVAAADRNGQDLVWTVEALDGESVGGWAQFFAALSGVGRAVEFRENEVVVLLRLLLDTVTLTDSLSASSAAPESRVGYAKVDQSEVGV